MGDKPISAKESKKTDKVYEKKKPSGNRYFKANKYAGLKFVVKSANDLGDPTTIKYVGFKMKRVKVLGYDEYFGYLETSDASVIAKCEALSFVEEIDQKVYKQEIG